MFSNVILSNSATGSVIVATSASKIAGGVRTCTDCGELKPISHFLPIKSTKTGYYGRCLVCRARLKRERYWSNPQARAAEIARSLRNKRRRAARRRDASFNGEIG